MTSAAIDYESLDVAAYRAERLRAFAVEEGAIP